MEIQGVIFDLGHTLMHLDGTWPMMFDQGVLDLAAYLEKQELALDGKAFGRALIDRRAEGFARAKATNREMTAEESMRWTFAQFGISDPGTKVVEDAIDAFFAFEESRWYADEAALPILRDFSERGLRQGIYSNATDDRFIQRLVDRFGYRPWLGPVLTSAGTGIRKPDPDAFAPILNAWQLPAQAIVVVGDRLEADILGAQRAGMQSVWFRSRPDARQEEAAVGAVDLVDRPSPNATIEHLEELPAVVSRFGVTPRS